MIWYPYTQMKNMLRPFKITGARGIFLYTDEKELIDSISSWWCKIYGYHNEFLDKALVDQATKLSHVMLAGLEHDPVKKLSEKLEKFLPGDLNYTFFSDSGSVGVEVALKMAIQFQKNRKYKRDKILALKNAYHGDTFMAMAVSDNELYHKVFFKENSNIVRIGTSIEELEKVFKDMGEEFSCFILEPLLQCAGGFRIHDINFLKKARILADKYDVVLIFDEIATGFGRTGVKFVSDLVLPDIIVIGKALTGGYSGHAATVTNKKIFDGFYGDDESLAFNHGPTFMGNPLATRLALESINLFEKENFLEKVKNIENIAKKEFSNVSNSNVLEIRIIGACFCIELKNNKNIKNFVNFAYDRGIFARPFGNYIYSMPPYIIDDENLIKIINVMKEFLNFYN